MAYLLWGVSIWTNWTQDAFLDFLDAIQGFLEFFDTLYWVSAHGVFIYIWNNWTQRKPFDGHDN
jgi:hypothetical protein